MATYDSLHALGVTPVPTCEGSEVTVYRSEVALPATHALNQILGMGFLPADHVFSDLMIDSTRLDTNATPAMTLQFGFLNAAQTGLDTVLATTTICQSGGVDRISAREFLDVVPSTVDRPIGFRISANAATKAAGRVGLTVSLRS